MHTYKCYLHTYIHTYIHTYMCIYYIYIYIYSYYFKSKISNMISLGSYSAAINGAVSPLRDVDPVAKSARTPFLEENTCMRIAMKTHR